MRVGHLFGFLLFMLPCAKLLPMNRCLVILCVLCACVVAGWLWHFTRPSVWLERVLELPHPLHIQHASIESSYLFHYSNAYCDIPCTEKEFRQWQARIHGVSVEPLKVPFPTRGMPPTIQEGWIRRPLQSQSAFQARRPGAGLVAVWQEGRAYVDFGQRGKLEGTWEMGGPE